jgi:hypothetical protein
MDKKLEEMIPVPVEVERSIKNVVGSEKVTASISAIDYTPIFQKEMNVI